MGLADGSFCWSAESLESAVAALLRSRSLGANRDFSPGQHNRTSASVNARIEASAAAFDCEAVRVSTNFGQLAQTLGKSSPAILRLNDSVFIAIQKAQRSELYVIDAAGKQHKVHLEELCDALRDPLQRDKRDAYMAMFTASGLSTLKARHATAALLHEQFGALPFDDLWILRRPIARTNLTSFLRLSGVYRNSVLLVAAHVTEYLLWLAAWGVMGKLSFSGRMDPGWVLGWSLLLLTTVPFRIATTWLSGVLTIGVGSNLKRRLLAGSLALDSESVRHMGVGSYLSQALEAEAVETLALGGGITGLLSLIELAMAGVVLGTLSMLLAAWCCVTGLLVWRFFGSFSQWTTSRMEMTGDLVENLAGHRTRVAQMSPGEWHASEEASLLDYFGKSRSVDHTGMWLVAAIPRGWLITGLLWLVPTTLSESGEVLNSGPELAVKLGGVLLAFTAFKKLTAASVDLVATTVAARRIAPLFHAAQAGEEIGPLHAPQEAASIGEKLLEADRVTFRYREEGPAALQPSSLTIGRGEKILLEGSSGGGKTTLASLLSGMRKPASGLLLLNGLDSHTIGLTQWRRRIAAAPQFHENYIFTDTLAHNLLLGREGPLRQQDLQDAEELCRELGLGELLDRMPGGIEQLVGEGGWQLSHGERSRIYAARALLQNADCIILDESFGALDPENLRTALQCTLKRAETLMVIAHP